MIFIHLKIYGMELPFNDISKILSLKPITILKAGTKTKWKDKILTQKQDFWNYSIELDDISKLQNAICDLSELLYKQKDLLKTALSDCKDVKLYFIITPYIESYQMIINLNCDLLSKISASGFDLLIDIMSP